MSEDIKKNEINEAELENVAGGSGGSACPKCSKTRMSQTNDFFCETCDLEF